MIKKLLQLRKNTLLLSGFFKGISGITLFASMSLLIKYLGESSYGVWVLLFTLFQWVLFMDFGISNVLKTKLPELISSKKTDSINLLIRNSYKITLSIGGVLFGVLVFLIWFINLKENLNIPFSPVFIKKLFLLNAFAFCLNFVLITYKSLYIGILRTHIAEQSAAITQIVFLGGLAVIFIFGKDLASEDKLMAISLLNAVVAIAVNLYYTLLFFKKNPFTLFKKIQKESHEEVKIFSLGSKFMVIQIFMLIVFSSDSYILSHYSHPAEVTVYDVVTKYFQFPMLIAISAMSPLWSMFSKHYTEKNHDWMKKAIRHFSIGFAGFILIVIILALLCNPVLSIWINKNFYASGFFIVCVAIMVLLRVYFSFFSYFFNGIGKLKSQLYLMGFGALVKIPLTILLLKMDFGVSSVILSTNILMLFWSIFLTAESKLVLKEM